MIRDRRLLICAGFSIVGHVVLARGLRHLPKRADGSMTRVISLRVVSPPPAMEPPPEPAPEPQAPVSKSVPHERPHTRSTPPVTRDLPPKEIPPPDRPALTGGGPTDPVFGITMESTSQAAGGPAMRVGRTGGAFAPAEEAHSGPKAPLPPVPAYEVTTMPLPQGRCVGKYTEEAKRAAIEGTVILDLIVSETGRVRDVRVVSALQHGLTEAAIAAVKECRFSPGEKDGTPVPVRVRGFKIRFMLDSDE
jgi:periplasmic protein TonB